MGLVFAPFSGTNPDARVHTARHTLQENLKCVWAPYGEMYVVPPLRPTST